MLLTLALSSFLAQHWHKSNRLVLALPPSRSPSTGASNWSGSYFVSPAAASAIGLAIDQHFASFTDHPVVKEARSLTANRGISFDAPMSFAIHLQGERPADLTLTLDPYPERLEERWIEISTEP